MNRKYLLCSLLVLLIGLPLIADTVIEEIVARVNDRIVTRSDLNKSKEQLQEELKQQNIPDTDQRAKEKNKDLLRDLIDQQLLVERGKDLGITGIQSWSRN